MKTYQIDVIKIGVIPLKQAEDAILVGTSDLTIGNHDLKFLS